MIVYKLTDENACTYNGTQWGEGVTHTITLPLAEFAAWAISGEALP